MNIHAQGGIVRRREEVLRIVRESTVHSQDELLAALRKRGVQVTQPTLSRDLRELGLAKTPSGYVAPGDFANVSPIAAFRPAASREERLDALFRDSVLSAEAAGNLVVIKTPTAAAQPVASAIDAAPIADILGTIGGDDTIFIALTSPAAATELARHFQSIAGIGPSRRRTRA